MPLLVTLACGGGTKKVVEEPEPIVEAPRPAPPPPPPPVCVRAGAEMSLIGMVEADDAWIRFCVSDGAESTACYSVDVNRQKYAELDEAPRGQSPMLDPDPARVETTNKEVKVCIGDDCRAFKPKVPKSDNPIDAVTNAEGTHAAVLVGNQEKGKGTAELWDVGKGKKLATVKYAKGSYRCGEARMLGSTLYVSTSVCAGPQARATLYNLKGKKIADVGSKEFGSYGTVPVQVTDTVWAFLDENAAVIALQDVTTGKVEGAIDIGTLWASGDDPDAPALGNPGESALVRGGDGKLVVVSGGPKPGSVGIVNVESRALESTIASLVCEPEAGGGGGDDLPDDDDDE
jgi:hypothetical protein